MNILQNRELKTEAALMARTAFRGVYDSEIHQRFVERTHDAEFAAIGAKLFGPERAAKVADTTPHFLVWAGYEVAVGGPHTKG